MAYEKTADSLDEIQAWTLSCLLTSGIPARPRGLNTRELFPVMFSITNPRKRCVANPARRWSLPLALGEFCWHVSGSNELQFIEYYARRWREFSDDASTIRGSCYGHRIFRSQSNKTSQWGRIVALLRMDSESRRAVLYLDESTGDPANDKDLACTCSIQFLVRDNKLHAITYMRSNDAIWGLPYDVFFFTMLQELLACELGRQLGTYTHVVGSLHLYENHYALASRVVQEQAFSDFEMPPMRDHRQLKGFLDLEAGLRTDAAANLEGKKALNPYWRDLLAILEWYRRAKDSGGYEAVATDVPLDSPYRMLLCNLAGTPDAKTHRYAAQTTA